MKKLILLVASIAIIMAACEKKEESNLITGTLTLMYNSIAGDYYVYLDTDTDPANGFVKQIINPYTANQTGIKYSFDTEGLDPGPYYLLAGYDTQSDTNMDPLNPSKWEGKGWYGSTNSIAPESPNVKSLSGTYNITIYGLD